MRKPVFAAALTAIVTTTSPVGANEVLTAAASASSVWWYDCVKEAATALVDQQEKAAVVVDAAFNICSPKELVWFRSYRDANPGADIVEASEVHKIVYRDGAMALVLSLRAAKDRASAAETSRKPIYRPMSFSPM